MTRLPLMPLARCLGAAAILAAMFVAAPPPADAQESETPAKELFGREQHPAPLRPRSIGSYSRGCLAGARPLAMDGPSWQVMRLSRNRNWGHPALIDLLETLAEEAPAEGWNGLLVGDLAQPRGGPMLTGHASHQIGLDADIWLTPMPDRRLTTQEREEMSAVSMLAEGSLHVDPAKWTPPHARLIRRAALFPETDRIFVHPGIKKALCDFAGTDRRWLRKVRPWWGHHYHFHIRLACPPESPGCADQAPPPPSDGCGAELDWWFTDEPWTPSDAPAPPPLTLADLPPACERVLDAEAQPMIAPAPLPADRPAR